MGLHKICKHQGRARDRCKHAWWGSFRGKRVSLAKWTTREITSKAEADKALDELTAWIRLDSEGEHKADDVAVFSNEAGEALKTFKKAWVVAVLKAHGVDPRWRKGAYKDLSAECQQRFRDINLHWHDLRHEYASRLVERGVPLAQVRDLLGHASIITTERYDNQRLEALQAAVERLEGGKTFDPKIDASGSLSAVAVLTGSAKAEVSRIFQDPTEQSFARSEDPAKESATSH